MGARQQRVSGWWKLICSLCERTYESSFGELFRGERKSHVTGCVLVIT